MIWVIVFSFEVGRSMFDVQCSSFKSVLINENQKSLKVVFPYPDFALSGIGPVRLVLAGAFRPKFIQTPHLYIRGCK
jgi:hypothetical protein